ncbi:MAG: hypothetical protein HY690_03930 [Chloroflexi bacterium]|nr:hypothetical protein [Chloroflexota bacterium]
MYTSTAIARRRCLAARADGTPCRAWALWDDPGQRCLVHAGRNHHGPLLPGPTAPRRARYTPCLCPGYAWPHRPGGGWCRWPDPPLERCPIPAGTHGWPRRT